VIGPQQHNNTIVISFHSGPNDAGRSLIVVILCPPSEAAGLLTGCNGGLGAAKTWEIFNALESEGSIDVALDSSSSFSMVSGTSGIVLSGLYGLQIRNFLSGLRLFRLSRHDWEGSPAVPTPLKSPHEIPDFRITSETQRPGYKSWKLLKVNCASVVCDKL